MRVRRSLVSMALAMALTAPAAMAMTQSQLDGMGQGVDLKYQVIDNTLTDGNSFRASITLRNNTAQPLPATGWSLWFSHIRDVSKLYTDQFKVTHVNGDIFKLEPTAQFRGGARRPVVRDRLRWWKLAGCQE